MANDTISQVHIGESNYDICDVKNREDVKDLQTYIDEEMYSASEVDDLLSTKVDEADFVDEPTGKEDGIEIVLPQGTPTSPIVLSEIDDSDELKHSTVHTSSNHYINTKLEAINNSLAGKMSIQFVDELPASPDRNTQYYVETETTGVWNIYISDNLGVVRAAGTTELDMDSYVRSTTKVAGVKLEADISAQQIEDATKSLSATLTNKSIDASDNTISNIATPNMTSSAIATSISSSPVDTKLATEKSIYDYAVPKTSTASQVYGSSSNYTLATSISNASTAAQIPTAKSIYDYAVPKTSTANQIYGSSANYTLSTAIGSSSTATQIPTAKSIYDFAVPKTSDANKIYGSSANYTLSTAIGSSSTATQIPTAKSIYDYAVPKTTTGSRIYGTNSSGAAYNYPFSDTYTSTASNQLFTRAGAYSMYSNAYNGQTNVVFCGNVTRSSTQSASASSWTAISLTGSDIYRTGLVSLASSGVKILKAGTYRFEFIVRLADTVGATRHWCISAGTSSAFDDSNGGQWLYTYFRHKGEASHLRYCTVNEVIKPYVYIDGNAGTIQFATVRVFKLNEK